MRKIILSSTHPVKHLHGNTQAEWNLMTEEEQLLAWLKTCPFDYLEVGKIEGIRTINFEINGDKLGEDS
tara:strand:+ start:59 stop:265 length:207 start_codon:yes stop_codon:yes gene_type:complete